MSQLPPCPQCSSEYTYEDGVQLVCPECGHEWSEAEAAAADAEGTRRADFVVVLIVVHLQYVLSFQRLQIIGQGGDDIWLAIQCPQD